MAQPKLRQARFRGLTVTYECEGQTVTATPLIDVEGGGCCHQEMCYCPGVEVMAEISNCTICQYKHSFDLR